MSELSSWVREILGLAKELRGIPTDVMWIFLCLILAVILIYDKTEAHRKDTSDREIREIKSQVESKTAEALEKLGDAYVIQGNAYRSLADRFETAIDLLTRRP